MHILVSGQICLNDERERSFSQTFLLDKKTSPVGDFYVIKHDMLHLMELPEMTQEIVEEIVEEVPVESEKVADEPAETVDASATVAEELEKPAEPAQPVPSFIPTFSSEPVVEKEVEPVAEKPVEPEEKEEEKPVEPAEPVAEKKEEPMEPATMTEPELVPELTKPEEKKEPVTEKKEEKPVETPKKKEEEKKDRKPRSYNGLFQHARRPANRRVVEKKPEEKKEEEFVVVKSRFTKKSSTCGSTVRVHFHSDSVNEEALLQLFKVGME